MLAFDVLQHTILQDISIGAVFAGEGEVAHLALDVTCHHVAELGGERRRATAADEVLSG